MLGQKDIIEGANRIGGGGGGCTETVSLIEGKELI